MFKIRVLQAVLFAGVSSGALAADLPSRSVPPTYVAPAPVFSWTGFYVGGQIGYGFGQDRGIIVAPPALAGTGGLDHIGGVIGGAHVGYNLSTASLGAFEPAGLVLGIEGDVDGNDYRLQPNPNLSRTLQIGVHDEIQGSVRGRVGLAIDRALIYATGGAALSSFDKTFSAPGLVLDRSHMRVGWTVGGGVEYALTPQWSARMEYRYSDFGTFRDDIAAGLAINTHETMQRVEAGFSYKFDTATGAPVVARY